MIDMSTTIIAKSDQLNADDLIGRSVIIKVTKVSLLAGEQPISIHYEGDEGKPWKPCKSMRRILVGVWGSDGNAYIGRSLTLYRDDSVTFGGQAVGGVRIGQMSHIDKAITISLTATKKSKKPFTVRPMATSQASNAPISASASSLPSSSNTTLGDDEIFEAKAEARKGTEHMTIWWKSLGPSGQKKLVSIKDELKRIADDADAGFGIDEF